MFKGIKLFRKKSKEHLNNELLVEILSVRTDNIEKIADLLKRGADVNAKDGSTTALAFAAANRKTEVVELLIKNGADLNAKLPRYGTILNYILSYYDSKTPEIAKLLIENGADVNVKNMAGQTPLMNAIYTGYKETAELLIEHGADINAKAPSGDTILIDTIYGVNPGMAELLIKNSVDINAKGKNEGTALQAAVRTGNKKIVELLLKNGADIYAKDIFGLTAKDYANGEDIKEMLITAEKNLAAQGKGGK